MARDVVVRAEGLGKQYRLGQMQTGYRLLSEVVTDRVKNRRLREPSREPFWALRDISFEVAKGETFGIIGHNGAGKSTLLKILARVTPPTEGELRLRGRVGALLEVGTGFHAELSGRENIFLNGAILGMRRGEIARKFDEIVEFAEVERFIDTPVKRYSSGMYLRLAFAVAAYLEPEVLIVDEVLSVGDMAFQQKCLGRMESVAGEGRTVLFVSHNLSAVSKLCPRSMLLSHGEKITEGPTRDVIEAYVAASRKDAAVPLAERSDRQGNGRVRFQDIAILSDDGPVDAPQSGQDIEVVLHYKAEDGQPVPRARVGVSIYTAMGDLMLNLQNDSATTEVDLLPPEGAIRCRIPRCPLPAGGYTMNVLVAIGDEVLDWVQRAMEFTVVEGDFFGTGRLPSRAHQAVLVDHSWSVAQSQ